MTYPVFDPTWVIDMWPGIKTGPDFGPIISGGWDDNQ